MSRSIILPVHVAFLLLAIAHSSIASAEISGTVIDASGKPIEGASIMVVQDESDFEQKVRWLSDDPSPVVIAEATSDSKGNYTLDLDEGLSVAQLQISSPGRLTAEIRVPHDGWIGATLLRDATERRGRVIAEGEPVGGAVIVLRGPNSFGGIQVVSDDKGLFALPELPGPFHTISVLHPDYAPFHEERFRLRDDVTIPLDPGISLSGRVVGTDGETPVADAVVSIDGWPLGESGEDGTFTLEHAPKNWSSAKISKGGLTADITRSTAKSTTVQLRKTATISGTVVDAETGRGISGAAVSLEKEGFRNSARERTYTDEAGRFSFPPVLAGTYSLTTHHPSWSSRNEPVTVVDDSDIVKRITTTRTGTARGRAVDERGEKVAAAAINAEPEGVEDFARLIALSQGTGAYSAPDGRFVVFGIEPDKPVRIAGTHRSYPAAEGERFVARSGETTSGADIVFPTGVSITGVVTTSSGDPIRNAEISVSKSDQGPRSGATMIFVRSMFGADQPVLTDASGEFDVKVSEGEWDLAVKADGFAPKKLNAIETRGGLEPLEITLEEGATIQGRVTRAGTGVPDVMIAVMSGGSAEPITTGSDGSFSIDDLPRGPVALMAFKPAEMIREMRTVEAPLNNLVIEVPAGGAIRGRLIDEGTGEPVTDFQAGASADRGDGSMQIRFGGNLQPYHSDDGEFFIDNVPPGRTQILFEAPGYVGKSVKGIEVVEGETIDGLEIEISRGVRVTGTVRDEDGKPLAGVSVRIEDGEESFFPSMPMMPDQITTDSAGEYIIPAATAGETTIAFSKDGYVSARRSAELEGTEARVDATLASGRSVSGIVVSHSGAPVAGARVHAQSAAQESRGSSSETDATGQFTLEGLADGRYTFVANHPDYVSAASEDVDVTGNQPVRLVMGQGGTIVGRIIGAEPSTYSSIEVLARVGSSGVYRSPVSPDGAFRIEAVPPGKAQVVARMGRIFDSRSSETRTVEVAAGSQVSVDLDFVDGAVVSGLVSRDGEPLRSGVVRFGATDGSSSASTSIDSAGRYTISGLQTGTYDLYVIDFQSSSPYTERVEITSSSQTIDIDIRGGRILGRITDSASGQPVENATISVEPAAPQQGGRMRLGATTGATGEFVVESVSAGSYRLRVERAGYGLATRDVFVSEGEDQTVDVSLQPTEGVTLRVVDARDGRSLTADVSVYDSQNRPVWEGRPSPKEDGTIQVPVGTGTYRVWVSATGYAPSTAQISSPAPTETIGLSRGGSLVIESRSNAPLRARAIGPWGLPHRESRWNRSGEISIRPGTNRFENLATGEYTLEILGESGAPVRSESFVIREGDITSLTI